MDRIAHKGLLIHPLSVYYSESSHGSADVPFPSNIFQLLWQDPEALPGQSLHHVLGLPWGLPLVDWDWKTSNGRHPEGILMRCQSHHDWLLLMYRGNSSTLNSYKMFELHISKVEPDQTTEKTHSGSRYSRSHCAVQSTLSVSRYILPSLMYKTPEIL